MPAFPKALPRLCVALGFPTIGALSQAAERECKDGATFLEFRLDHLSDPAAGLELIRKFRRVHPETHILATCRHRHAAGAFSGTVDEQVALLRNSARSGAALVDLEIEIAEQSKAAALTLREEASLLVSYHNFTSTPSLDAVLRRLSKVPADAYKVATTARKPSDNLRLACFLKKQEGTPLVMLAMSEIGFPTRVLGPSLGSAFTYAAPAASPGTAPGQIPVRLFRSLYRPEKLGRQTRIFGIVADPVSHSKSPFIHNRAFQARRIDAVYLPFLVSPRQLGDWMSFAANLPVAGFSVTIPHKRNILRYLDTVEPLARRIGAVNTVWRKGGKWRGANTDAQGVLQPLSRHLRIPNASILIAGYGGAARAAAVALADARANVTITGRNFSEAQALARILKGEAIELSEAQKGEFDALVHATPVGTVPDVDECLFHGPIPARIVFDMVYNPHRTLLLKRAAQQGCLTIPGSEMLMEQAVRQFEIWTGETAPRDVMQSSLEQQI